MSGPSPSEITPPGSFLGDVTSFLSVPVPSALSVDTARRRKQDIQSSGRAWDMLVIAGESSLGPQSQFL